MQDTDLLFLSEGDNDQLKTLVDILVFDKDGKKLYAEQLSNTKLFCENYPDNVKAFIPEIVNEIQLFGGNTLVNMVRCHGVPYRTILEDVCDRMKVNYNKKLPTSLLETELLRKVALTVVEKMTEEDIKKFDENLDKTRLMDSLMSDNGAAMMTIIAIIVAKVSKQAATKGAFMLFGRALSQRVITLAVPVLNILAALWTVADIASPAYRVTIPFVLTTAFLRRQLETPEDTNNLFA